MASDERVLIPLPGTPGFEASVPLERLRKSLSTQGLHIVTDADMRVLAQANARIAELEARRIEQEGAILTLAAQKLGLSSELAQLRGRAAKVKALYEALPAIPQYQHLKPFATEVMATLEGWPRGE